jgi:hypothetical protein
MTIKHEHANLVVETIMEGVILILIQSKTIIILATITPSPSIVMKDLVVNVKVEVIKATNVEE